jgi:hypothetical protein
MKKIYTLVVGVLVCFFAAAQSFQGNPQPAMEFSKQQITPIIAKKGEINPLSYMKSVDILFEDFQDVSTPALPDGWTTVQVTTDPAGPMAGELTDAFITGDADDANGGGYWPVPNIGGNIFAQANDDNVPCDCDMFAISLTTPEMDFTDVGNAALSFDLFHDQGFGGGEGGVEVSIDGGTTWEILIATLPVDETVWQTIIVPLYDYAGEASLTVRFVWSDAGSWASGFAVDNVVVGELADYNVASDKVVFGNWNVSEFEAGLYDFSMVPLTQVSPVAATGVISNNGFLDQTNVSFDLEVFMDGNSQGTWSSDQTVATQESLTKDTLSVVTDFTPSGTGQVSITIMAVSESGDDVADDNDASKSMMITTDIYARDANGAQAFVDPGTAYQFGNLFDIYTTELCGGIQYAVGAGSDEGAFITGWVYDFEGFDDSGDPILGNEFYETTEHMIVAGDLNGVGENNFVTLPFAEGAVELTEGKTYLAVIATNGGNEVVRTPVSGTNSWAASLLFDGEWGWTLSIPMLRLTFDESVAVNEVVAEKNFAMMQNVPNPAIDNTRVMFHLHNAATVNFRVTDITGKVVVEQNRGTLPQGAHKIDLNVSDLPAGIYNYTLTVGDEQLTRQMIVQ